MYSKKCLLMQMRSGVIKKSFLCKKRLNLFGALYILKTEHIVAGEPVTVRGGLL